MVAMTDRRGNSPLSSEEAWETIMDVEYSHHFAVWAGIMRLERQGCDRINSTNVRKELTEFMGEFRTRESILTSMARLRSADIIGREEVTEWPHGYHWTTTELGREVAAHMAETWGALDAGVRSEGSR